MLLVYVVLGFRSDTVVNERCQGVVGSCLIKLNVQVAIYRRNSYLADWPVLEVVCVSAITAGISYLVRPFFKWLADSHG